MRHRDPRLIAVLTLWLLTLGGVPGPGLAADPPEWPHIQRAKDHRDEGKLKAAVIELKNALQANPKSAEARLLLGQTYLDLGQGANAEKELRRARQAGLDPVAVVMPLGEALLLQGKFAELLEQVTLTPGLPEGVQAEVHALRGEAHRGLRQPEEAKKAFQAALALKPAAVRARLGEARLALAEGQPDEARHGIEQVLATDPASAAGWGLLGDLEQSQGRHAQAEQAYDKAIQYSFNPAALQLKRALVRIELNDY